METIFSATIKKSTLITLICTLCFFTLSAQQYIIEDKDNTHPELKTAETQPAFITQVAAERASGYNEIAWTTLREENVRKYVIEYSTNGIDFQSAGELLAGKGTYQHKHHILDNSPMLYRIRTEQINNRSFYSPAFILTGARLSPVKIFPTTVLGNMINIDSYWPIERINVFSSGGSQVFSKDLNGQKDYISLLLPPLSKGMYLMAFQGRGWKTTEKFVVQ